MNAYPCRSCGAATVGNARGACRTCNRFAARVRRWVDVALRTRHPGDVEDLGANAVETLYPDIEWEETR